MQLFLLLYVFVICIAHIDASYYLVHCDEIIIFTHSYARVYADALQIDIALTTSNQKTTYLLQINKRLLTPIDIVISFALD